MSLNRVVVTGIGLVSPLGLGVKENWKNVIEGNCKVIKLIGEGIHMQVSILNGNFSTTI